MYEQGVVEALRTLIIDNESDLLDGINYQGVQKTIGETQIVTSTLTPPVLYPHIIIIVREVREISEPTARKATRHPTRKAFYDTMIEVTENAIVVEGEDFPYEQMQNDFRLLTDRMVQLIKTQEWITETGFKAQLQRGEGDSDRVVRKRNNSGYWMDTETNWWATLNCQILFTLESCVDDSVL